jgi:4-carboxymuconolactone decarboxylase
VTRDLLPPDLRALVRLSAALGRSDPGALDRAIDEALARSHAAEAEEVLLQSYLFLGYPAALNALDRWRERTGTPAPRETTPSGPDQWERWAARGEAVFRTVYGEPSERLRRNVARLHPDLETWMVVEGYGKVLGREGLTLARRELCVVALLAQGGDAVHRQLYAHLRGALRAGASPGLVEETLAAVLVDAPAPIREGAQEVWRRVSARPTTSDSGDHVHR